MAVDPRILDLLARYETLAAAGTPVTPEQLCRDCPDLLDELRKRLLDLQAMNDRLGATAAVPPAAALPAVPGYEILGELGRGGMGVVYKACQTSLGRVVALKMLRAGDLAGPAELARFRAEVEAVARLKHPHIVPIYETGTRGADAWFSMEYLEGGTLARQLAGTPLQPREAARLTETLARAVHAVHAEGIVHRDLKPANVLLAADGTVKVSDFGLAKRLDSRTSLTPTGAVLGTPSYMAPEQATGKGEAVGPAADVYALGAILYELLTGRPPFLSANPLDTLVQVLAADPVPPRRLQPRVPRDLELICLMCLRKQPGRRYRTALELAEELRRFGEGEPLRRTRSTPLWERALKWARRRPAAAALLGASVVGLGLLLSGGLWYNNRLRSANELAERQHQHALTAAQVMTRQIAERIRPLAGTETATVEAILADVARVYDELLKEDDSAAARAGQGEMWNAIAAVDLEMNRPARAAEHTHAARQRFRQLLAEAPADARYQAGLAAACQVSGRVLFQQGRLHAALADYREALRLHEALAEREPGSADWKAGCARAYLFIGTVLHEQGDAEGQEDAYRRALRLRAGLAGAASADDRAAAELGVAHEHLGDCSLPRAPDVALREYRTALALYEALVRKTPGNADWQKHRVRVLTSLGQLHAGRGEARQAEECIRRSLEAASGFAALNPTSVTWQREHFRCRLQLAALARPQDPAEQSGLLQQQLEVNGKLQELSERLARQDETDLRWRADLARLLLQRGNLCLKLARAASGSADRLALAEKALRRALALQEALVKADETNVPWARALVGIQGLLGNVHLQQGKEVESQRAYLESNRRSIALNTHLLSLYPESRLLRDRRRQVARSRWLAGDNLYVLASRKALPAAALAEARQLLDTALSDYDFLLGLEPLDASLWKEVGGVYETMALVAAKQGNREEARMNLARVRAVKRLAGLTGSPTAADAPHRRIALLLELTRLRPNASWKPCLGREAARAVAVSTSWPLLLSRTP